MWLSQEMTGGMTSILKSGEDGWFIELSTSCTQPQALGIDEALELLK